MLVRMLRLARLARAVRLMAPWSYWSFIGLARAETDLKRMNLGFIRANVVL